VAVATLGACILLPYIAVNIDNTLARTSLAGDTIPADLPEEFYLEHLKELVSDQWLPGRVVNIYSPVGHNIVHF
jgi:hypothetical protein